MRYYGECKCKNCGKILKAVYNPEFAPKVEGINHYTVAIKSFSIEIKGLCDKCNTENTIELTQF